LHHVVFCVHRANQDQAASFWRDLGSEFVDIDLSDIGLRVLLDWGGGIEIISPTSAGPESAPFNTFLDAHGEGIYSVVVRADDLDGAIEVARRHGASLQMRQDRSNADHELAEAMVAPIFGMPVTFLTTSMPD
jgi:4-hydroxyphenylpyruvate dioxygenase-like putative hemolysin